MANDNIDGAVHAGKGSQEDANDGWQRTNSHAVAKALKLDSDGGRGSYFGCNICLEIAKKPILTCCGHLFCWVCFYKLPYYSTEVAVKECPVCRGEVIHSAIIPIYGIGDTNNPESSKLEFSCNICLEMAKEPILTFCHHLFCWDCFYKLPYYSIELSAKECPVCRGEVTDSAILPIYGIADTNNPESKLEESDTVTAVTRPPRPRAQRKERVRPKWFFPDLEDDDIILLSRSGDHFVRRDYREIFAGGYRI